MNPLEEINKLAHLLPLEVLQDIDKRVTDWLAAGGEDNDSYIKQQLRYARHVASRVNQDATTKHF